jgi:hypothetical protein
MGCPELAPKVKVQRSRGSFSAIVSGIRRFKFPFGPALYKHF